MAMEDNPVGAVVGAFALLIIAIITITVISAIINTFTEQQCQPYKNKITLIETEQTNLLKEVNTIQQQLEKCQGDYQNLIEYNITKQDFQEIKNYYNLTKIEIKTVNEKIDLLTQYYISIQNIVVNKYRISIALNIVLSLEILSFVFLKNELALVAFNWIRKKFKKHNGT